MACDHEGKGDVLVESSEHAPQQVSYNGVVLILTPTVVSVEVDVLPMYSEEVMEHADDGLASINSLVNKIP